MILYPMMSSLGNLLSATIRETSKLHHAYSNEQSDSKIPFYILDAFDTVSVNEFNDVTTTQY